MGQPVAALQRDIVSDYAASVGLDPLVHYAGGARLRPLPPLDARVGGIMIVGAYPSARFESMGGLQDVPVGDNLGPFEHERYFDGRRVRTQASADELAAHYLAPLGIDRRQCWITDLVKVFLFKEGHRRKYKELGIAAPHGYEREQFEDLGKASLEWLQREIAVARPRLLVTLGAEVAGIVRDVHGATRRKSLLGEPIADVSFLGAAPTSTVHLAHPGIVMRGDGLSRNHWPLTHREHIAWLRPELERLQLAP